MNKEREKQYLSQAEIERRIHMFRKLRATDHINSAQFRIETDPLRRSLKEIKKGGELNGWRKNK